MPMLSRKNTSAILYWVVAAVSLIMGSIYLFSPEFMPYHAAAIGLQWGELEPTTQILFSALLRLAGGGWVAVAAAIAILLLFPFRRDRPWSFWALPVISLIFYVPNLYATIIVTLGTPATAPWYGNAAGLGSAILAFALSPRPRS